MQQAMPLAPDETAMSHHPQNPTSPPDRLAIRNTPSGLNGRHSSEPSSTVSRGRPTDPASLHLPTSSLQPQTRSRGQSHSKSPESASNRPAGGTGQELPTVERKPSLSSYEHHRKTSIVHGIQHSRDPSYAASVSSASPLSPEIIASANLGSHTSGAPNADPAMFARSEQPDVPSAPGFGSSQTSLMPPSLTPIKDDDSSGEAPGPTNSGNNHSNNGSNDSRSKKIPAGGKVRREPSHGRGHSKHQSEFKTVGEYALHHLFNSVGPPRPHRARSRLTHDCQFVGFADAKINQSILRVGEVESPVEEVCGAGVDPAFDQIISALGHIARQKPKPLIDTIMLWRKAKGEAAAAAKNAASQVRKKPRSSFGVGD